MVLIFAPAVVQSRGKNDSAVIWSGLSPRVGCRCVCEGFGLLDYFGMGTSFPPASLLLNAYRHAMRTDHDLLVSILSRSSAIGSNLPL